MKAKNNVKLTFVSLLLGLGYLASNAQGVVVYKKDGSKIKVPYEQLDSISTYDYDDVPGGGDVTPGEPRTFTVNGVSFKMIPVKAGTFTMGATSEQTGAYDDEKPAHQVTLTQDYYMGETEVTQALWEAVTGYSPTSGGDQWSSTYGVGYGYPAYYISYEDVQSFIGKLNSLTGETFRMPTEAEWEYAARGGSESKGYRYSGSNTPDNVAWYRDNSGDKTHPVKTKAPNELGLYDMSGNVYEWCSDWFSSSYYSSSASSDPEGPTSGSYRVGRGGSWNSNAAYCRVAARGINTPSHRYYGVGFRLALSSK